MKITCLKYGNTNTYLCGELLIDTDMPGTMPALRREMKRQGIPPATVRYVLATHYHPDHAGLIGELTQNGVRLLLLDHQKEYVHFPDAIFARNGKTGFLPIDEARAIVITPEESRAFLASIGIGGQIVPTKSHSADGAAIVLDDGNAFVGDLEPLAFLDGYEEESTEKQALRDDWNALLSLGAKIVRYGHANEQRP